MKRLLIVSVLLPAMLLVALASGCAGNANKAATATNSPPTTQIASGVIKAMPAGKQTMPAGMGSKELDAAEVGWTTAPGSADKATVALVDRFIAAYNARSRGDNKPLEALWVRGSKVWAGNPWLRPNNLGWDDIPADEIRRISPVVQVGDFDGSTPFLTAFKTSWWGTTWIAEWSADGTRVLAVWVP